jgi:hypothetical protein
MARKKQVGGKMKKLPQRKLEVIPGRTDVDVVFVSSKGTPMDFWFKDEELLCGGCGLLLATPAPKERRAGNIFAHGGGKLLFQCPSCGVYNEMTGAT